MTEPRRAHRPSRRHEVVAAAVRVFARQGYAGTTVADIAAEAGMAPAAVYYHFASKEEVLVAAVRAIGDEIGAARARALAGGGADVHDDLAHVVTDVFEWADEHPDEAQLFYLWSAGVSAAVEDVRREFVAHHVAGADRYARARSGQATSPSSPFAARSAIATAVATAVAWLSDDVFPAGTRRDDVTSALVGVMERLLQEAPTS